MATSPELAEIIDALQSRPTLPDITWEERRAGMEEMQAKLVLPEDTECETADANGVPVEWIRTAASSSDRVIFYLHGGGYAIGSIRTHRFLMQAIARAAEATVLGVDYRLAPEHHYPAALDDSMAAWEWLLEQGVDASSAIIGGDSAGGGLTLATLLRLRDEGGELPAGAVCLSPWTDLASSVGPVETKRNDPMVTSEVLGGMARAYVGSGNANDPLISPILADPKGLPLSGAPRSARSADVQAGRGRRWRPFC